MARGGSSLRCHIRRRRRSRSRSCGVNPMYGPIRNPVNPFPRGAMVEDMPTNPGRPGAVRIHRRASMHPVRGIYRPPLIIRTRRVDDFPVGSFVPSSLFDNSNRLADYDSRTHGPTQQCDHFMIGAALRVANCSINQTKPNSVRRRPVAPEQTVMPMRGSLTDQNDVVAASMIGNP